MDFDGFRDKVRSFQARYAAKQFPPDFDSWTASPEELSAIESALGTRLPAQYKQVMQEYGAGHFAFVELMPVRSVDDSADLLSVNTGDLAVPGFVAVAPVGTGDYWGFASTDGECANQVYFWFHDDQALELAAEDFLEFVVKQGLRDEV
jgi:antitoxin YobK